jgi:ATP-dependent Clp protease ATP-binding subunit ClpB
MQADRFTIKAQEAIAAAGQLAERRHNPQVTPEHLLSVLLEQDGGVVAPVLAKLGADVRGLRTQINADLDALPTMTAGGEAAGPSSELVRVLREGEEEMRELKDEYVSTEHLLLALAATHCRRRSPTSGGRTRSPTSRPRTSTRPWRSSAAT